MATPVDLSAIKGKSTLIIGGASGIGLAISTRFALSGAYVTIADVQKEAGANAAADLKSQGCNVTFTHCNVTDFGSIVGVFKEAIAFSPSKSLDVVALVAGVMGEQGSLVDQVLKSRTWSEGSGWSEPVKPRHPATDINLLGVYDCAYIALHYMASSSEPTNGSREEPGRKETKSLILVSSTAAYTDSPMFPDYQVSKFGVRGLFRSLRHSTSALNIRLNALAPHFVRTPLVEAGLKTLAANGLEPGKSMTFIDVETVVDAAVRLAVDETLSGRTLCVFPEPHGIVDIGDDTEGWWGGQILGKIVEQMIAEGNLI